MNQKKKTFELNLLLFCFLFCITIQGITQSVQNTLDVMSSGGEEYEGNGIIMSYSIGELATETFSNSGIILTQGYHQPEDIFLNVIGAPQQSLVITPNNDGLNENLFLEDIQNYPNNEILVLNRWGSLVFQAQPYLNDWNGTHGGKPLPEGTYYYIVKLDMANAEVLYGSITIKR